MRWLYYFTNDEESDSNGFVLTTQQYIFLEKFLVHITILVPPSNLN